MDFHDPFKVIEIMNLISVVFGKEAINRIILVFTKLDIYEEHENSEDEDVLKQWNGRKLEVNKVKGYFPGRVIYVHCLNYDNKNTYKYYERRS